MNNDVYQTLAKLNKHFSDFCKFDADGFNGDEPIFTVGETNLHYEMLFEGGGLTNVELWELIGELDTKIKSVGLQWSIVYGTCDDYTARVIKLPPDGPNTVWLHTHQNPFIAIASALLEYHSE